MYNTRKNILLGTYSWELCEYDALTYTNWGKDYKEPTNSLGL